MIFTDFGLKISRKCDPKNTQKTGPSENRVFGATVSLSEAPGIDVRRFYLRKHLPGASIFGVFSRTAIMSKLCSRCSGNTIFKCRTLQKSTRRATPKGTGTKNRRKSHPAPSLGALFRPRTRFWSILGSRRGEAKFMKNALEEVTAKNAKKKSQRCGNTRWSGVMRWASGEVRRGHTPYDSPPKGACRIMQSV